ncbi:MAG: thiamine pyrophosphate-dependent enzyme [Candidatus Hodarchaeota archaeon]
MTTKVHKLAPGHRGCAGCGELLAARLVADALGDDAILVCCTGCLEVTTTPYPESAWEHPWIHSLFENSASIASGVEAALKALGREKTRVVAMGGDGGTIDIGIRALSGMFERYHDILYVCYDNEAYMNTGIQRSGSTPLFGSTTTSPAGRESWGNERPKKWLPDIALAHGVPYVATANVAFYADLQRKIKNAMKIEGPKYIQIFVPCPTGWYYDGKLTIEIARLAHETALFPVVEIDNQDPLKPVLKAHKIKERKPVETYLSLQRRFRHLFKDEAGKKQIAKIQAWADYMVKKYNLE